MTRVLFRILLAAAWSLSAPALLVQCTESGPAEGPGPNPREPIVVVGVDGLEWDVVLPLIREGRLPHLRALMERGRYGELETVQPTLSPVIWTTVVTGKGHDRHGIHHFARDRGDGELELFDSTDRRTAALWNILSARGRSVCSIGWWMTWPVEEIEGVMVAQTNTDAQLDTEHGQHVWKGSLVEGMPDQVFPPQRQEELLGLATDVDRELDGLLVEIFGEFPRPLTELGKRLWENCRWAFRADAIYQRVARHLLAAEDFDLTLLYFGGTDVAGHRFWRFMQPELYRHQPRPGELKNFQRVIPDYYAWVDRCIGELVEIAGPEATLVVISDHGMQPIHSGMFFDPDDPPRDVNSADHIAGAPPGVLIAAGPRVPGLDSSVDPGRIERTDLPVLGSVFDLAPTLLAWLDIPAGEDMDGEVMDSITAAGIRPPPPIATHDTEEFLARRAAAVPTRPGTARSAEQDRAEQERLEQLRELGYLDDGE